MQPGARFAIGNDLGYAVNREGDGVRRGGIELYIGNIGRAMDHEATEIFDVTCRGGDRFAMVYDSIVQGSLLLEASASSVDVTLMHAVPPRTRRVAMTDERWYVASDAEVHVLVHRTDPALDLIALDPIDIAASPTLLCVVEPRGLAWFDRDGRVVARRALASPTAAVYDVLADGWLVAADGDVLQLATPTAEPVILARGVGLATRIRRDANALYATTTDGELVEVLGISDGPTSNAPRVVAAFAPGWTQFDARFELYIDEGGGPHRFVAD